MTITFLTRSNEVVVSKTVSVRDDMIPFDCYQAQVRPKCPELRITIRTTIVLLN